MKLIKFTCSNCKIEFERDSRTCHANKVFKNRFCTTACKKKWQKTNPKECNLYKGVEKKLFKCEQCSKEFELYSTLRFKEHIFCSKECSNLYFAGENAYNYTRITKQCNVCGKDITRYASYFNKYNTLTCSSKCSGKLLSEENSPAWKGGVTPLHTVIRKSLKNEEWRIGIFITKGNSCTICNSKNKVQAHHIKPFSVILSENNIITLKDADECQELWSIDNGEPLCEDCHTDFHSAHGKNTYEVGNYYKWKEDKIIEEIIL